jgi:DNA-binding transcriptional LysR family regulator
MDRFDAMALLVEVVDSGSLTAASRRRRVPLPTISRRLTDLEARLGVQLLIRTTRKVTVTDAGREFVAASRRILEQVAEAERTAAGDYAAPKGELSLTAPIQFGRLHVLPIVTAFLAQYPQISVRLGLSDRNVHLVDDHVDMAVRIGVLPDSSLMATRVGSVRMVCCASPAFLAACGEPKTLEDLADLPCVTFDFAGPAREWLFREAGRDRLIPVRSRLSVSTAEAAIDAAAAGAGITRLVSYQAAGPVAEGRLRTILQAFSPEPMPVSVLHASSALMPSRMRVFLDFAAPRLRAALAAGLVQGEGAGKGEAGIV